MRGEGSGINHKQTTLICLRFGDSLSLSEFMISVYNNQNINVRHWARKNLQRDWITMWLVWVFAQRASEEEKLLARQVNLLVQDDQMFFFFFEA